MYTFVVCGLFGYYIKIPWKNRCDSMPSSIVLASDFWNQFPCPLLVGKNRHSTVALFLVTGYSSKTVPNFSLCKFYVERKPSCWSL